MKLTILSVFIFGFFCQNFGLASEGHITTKLKSHEASPLEMLRLSKDPMYIQSTDSVMRLPPWQPAAETADFKYVLFSAEADFAEAQNLRNIIAKNLPDGVKLVVLVDSFSAADARQNYAKFISLDRVIFANASDISNGFWARDAFPYPVLGNGQRNLSLVAANYYRPFRAQQTIAQSLGLNMQKGAFTFVGGNLLADENGTCFSINGPRLFNTTVADLINTYGCKTVHLLKHVAGIGDVDEVLKPIGNNVVLTNRQEYVNELKSWGYSVVMLPVVPNTYRTYANSLIIGKTAFMPTYGMAADQQAKQVYESLGYKVVGIPTNFLSDQMHGSVHCQTMAYPAISEESLLEMLGATRASE